MKMLHEKLLLHGKYASSTMCNVDTFVANIDLAEQVQIMGVQGCVVECGVWRGGMIAGIAEVLGPERHYVLCDSFQGLPPAMPIDGPAALEWQANDPNNCRATPDEARESMRVSGVTSYRTVSGWFCDTLPSLAVGPIALLRLDADWYDSTTCCLDNLFDRVARGGIVVLDDYYVWDGCSRAVHDFLAGIGAVERIRCLDGVAYIEKGR